MSGTEARTMDWMEALCQLSQPESRKSGQEIAFLSPLGVSGRSESPNNYRKTAEKINYFYIAFEGK